VAAATLEVAPATFGVARSPPTAFGSHPRKDLGWPEPPLGVARRPPGHLKGWLPPPPFPSVFIYLFIYFKR
jgi:hypothetical protein